MTSHPPPDPYGQQPDPYGQQQSDPYGQGTPPPLASQPQYGGPPPGQHGYPPPGGYAPPPPPPGGGTNTMAILALVFAFVFWPAGIVCGHIAKKQIAERGEEGAGLATAGLVLSYIFGGLAVLGCCLFGILAVAAEANVAG